VSTLDFIAAEDDGGGGDNWSYKKCKAPVKMSPPTKQHPCFFTGQMPFLSPNQDSPIINQTMDGLKKIKVGVNIPNERVTSHANLRSKG